MQVEPIYQMLTRKESVVTVLDYAAVRKTDIF